MPVYSYNEVTPLNRPLYSNSIRGVKFIINPADRRETSTSLVESQDQLMKESFPRKDYSILLVLHSSKSTEEWEFMKSTLITFEGMIRKKFKADEISYQESPQIELYFPKRDTESYQGDGKNTTTIQCLLKDHYENGGGLKYYLWDGALPTPWAVDCVTWGIVNKDDFRLD